MVSEKNKKGIKTKKKERKKIIAQVAGKYTFTLSNPKKKKNSISARAAAGAPLQFALLHWGLRSLTATSAITVF